MGLKQSKMAKMVKMATRKRFFYKNKQKSIKSFNSEYDDSDEKEATHLLTPEMNLDTEYDSMEIDRIHSHHFLLKHVWKGNFNSPIKSSLTSGKVDALEIKCGPGTWILDMATDYPDCTFIGVDMIPIFPSEIKPKNTNFVLVNQPEHLPFPTSKFSYVYVNIIEHTCMYKDHLFCQNDIINDIVKLMKSGAWLEVTIWSMELKSFGSVTQTLISTCKYVYIYIYIYLFTV
jgi:SAM-dependent methyltransferase